MADLTGPTNTHIRNIDSPYNQQPAKLETIVKAAEDFLKDNEKGFDKDKDLRKNLEAAIAKGRSKLAGAGVEQELRDLSGKANTHLRNITSPYNQQPAKLETILKDAENFVNEKAKLWGLNDEAKRLKKELDDAISKGRTKLGGAGTEQELRDLSGVVNTHLRNITSPYNQQPAKLEPILKAAEDLVNEKAKLWDLNAESKRLKKELDDAISKGKTKLAGAGLEQELRELSGKVNTHLRNITSPYNQDPAKLAPVVQSAEDFLTEKANLWDQNDEARRLKKELDAAVVKGRAKLESAPLDKELSELSGKVNTHLRALAAPVNQQTSKLESVVKDAENFLNEKASIMETNAEGKRLRAELEEAIKKAKSKLADDAAFPVQPNAPERKFGDPAVANAKQEQNINTLESRVNSTFYFLKDEDEVKRLIRMSGCESVEGNIMRAEQLIANNLALFNSCPEGKKMLDEFQSTINKAIETLEANRNLDGTAERRKLEAELERWSITPKPVALHNTEKIKLEVKISYGGMTSKTSINANTTAYGFCRPGETVVVSNNNGSIVVPEGATMLRIEGGSIRVV